jgi:hypothetical protein
MNKDDPICKICLESDGLLTDACGCRGTVGGIHLKCLKQTVRYEQTCSVCKSPYTYKVLHPLRHGEPLFWNWLGSPMCEMIVWTVTAFTFKFFHYKVVLTAQLLLLALYTVAYIPFFVAWLSDSVYRRKWLRQWLRCAFITTGADGRKVLNTPFPTMVAYFLLPLVPASLAFLYPYNKLWQVHKVIVGEMMSAEEADDKDE